MAKGKNTTINAKKRIVRSRSKQRRSNPSTPDHHATDSDYSLNERTIETALQTGEYASLLEEYFGPEHYQELRRLARESASRSVRGGARVLIIPGIMGSKIGKKSAVSPFFDDVYWIDPVDVAAGRLTQLKLGTTPSPLTALGVLLSTYLALKLRLRIWGFDAAFHPFDWRRSIARSGAELKTRLAQEANDKTVLVCHSMGGLVARWALAHGARCHRVIMLGTPNKGSFAPVMAFRGTHPVVRKVAFVDLRHTAEDLASEVFNTFPGLTEMLPTHENFDQLDLLDLKTWPKDRLRPRPELLKHVKSVQRGLAPADDRFFLIAGVNQETVTGLSISDEGFTYEYTNEGDGTVPLAFARLEGARTYFIEEAHGSLPNNGTVAKAIRDLVWKGRTDTLPENWIPTATREVKTRNDHQLRTDPYGTRRTARLSQQEMRHLLDEVAAPLARPGALEAQPPTITPGPAAPATGFEHVLEDVTVGRRREHRLDLRFAFGSITEVSSRAVALGIFRGVVPAGPARALDDELDGAITAITRRRMFAGNVGEVFILPTGRHKLIPDFISFTGLGLIDRFNDEVLQVAAENLLRIMLEARIEEFATVPIGAGSGRSPSGSLQAMLKGFLRALLDADADHHFRRIVICENDPARYSELKAELYRLSSTPLCEEIEITFDEVNLPAPRLRAERTAQVLPRPELVYLIVRQEGGSSQEQEVRSSVLTSGPKATVVTGLRPVRKADLDALIQQIADHQSADFSVNGNKLAELLLAEEVRGVLPSQRERHLVVVHDAPMSRVPWEVLGLPGSQLWHPAADRGLRPLYAAEKLSVAKWLQHRVEDNEFHVLIVVNPTDDLSGAVAEGSAIRQLVQTTPGAKLHELRGAAATRSALLAAFGSGQYDVIHFGGHAFFDEAHPERCGLRCSDAVVTGSDLAGVGDLPTLVFFNACESGRVRRDRRPGASVSPPAQRKRMGEGVGVAEALMSGGIANFVGTYWPVSDAAAEAFAKSFYSELLMGRTIGSALQTARALIRSSGSKDWANYIHYGQPDFVVKSIDRGKRT